MFMQGVPPPSNFNRSILLIKFVKDKTKTIVYTRFRNRSLKNISAEFLFKELRGKLIGGVSSYEISNVFETAKVFLSNLNLKGT